MNYSRLQLEPSLTRTLCYLEPESISPDFLYCNLSSVTRTLDNSKLPLTRSNFCFPSDHFHAILPSITRRDEYWLKNKVFKFFNRGRKPVDTCWHLIKCCFSGRLKVSGIKPSLDCHARKRKKKLLVVTILSWFLFRSHPKRHTLSEHYAFRN